MRNFKQTYPLSSDFWFYVVAIVIIILTGLMVYANAATGFRTDPLVQTIEQQQGMLPGSTKVIPQCGCTVRYLGTKIEGHIYEVYLDKLD